MAIHSTDPTNSAAVLMPTDRECWKIHSITYNINGQRPNGQSIKQWLDSDCAGADGNGFHIICIALQELPFAQFLHLNNTWALHITSWMNAHNLALASELYVASNALLIYFSWDILNQVDSIEDRWIRDSLFGKGTMATKVAFRNQIVLVFVTSHFFADQKLQRERIKQFHVGRRCTFPEQKSANKFVIWQGDLNSRMDGIVDALAMIRRLNSIGKDETTTKVQIGQLVNAHDQLTRARSKGDAFSEFVEADIAFKPTYRTLIGTGAYDPLRVPAWCDRILCSGDPTVLHFVNYSSCRAITLSDHFPVSAQFELLLPHNHHHHQQKRGTEQQQHHHQQMDQNDNEHQQRVHHQTLSAEAPPQQRQGAPGTAQTPPHWPIRVEHIPTWEEFIPLVCRVAIPTNIWASLCAYRDWIGVYPESLSAVSKPLEWMYVLSCPVDDERRTDQTDNDERRLIVEFQPLNSGRYRVGYFSSRKKCLLALSNSFFVRKAV